MRDAARELIAAGFALCKVRPGDLRGELAAHCERELAAAHAAALDRWADAPKDDTGKLPTKRKVSTKLVLYERFDIPDRLPMDDWMTESPRHQQSTQGGPARDRFAGRQAGMSPRAEA